MFSKRFWRDTAERVIATAAGAALASIVAGSNWRAVLVITGVASLVSLLKALVASQVAQPESASLIDTSKR